MALRSERGHVTLEIADSGPGLAEAARGRGLGLPVVREILVLHRFEFDLDNATGGGAVFRLRC